MSNIATLKNKTVNNELMAKYIKLKEELINIEEENKVKKEEKILASWESLFGNMGGKVEVEEDEEETPTFEQFQLQLQEDDEKKEELDGLEADIEFPQMIDEIVVPIQEEEEEIVEEQQQETTTPPTVKDFASSISKEEKNKPKVLKEAEDSIAIKIRKLEDMLRQLAMQSTGGGLDPNKISAHLIPTTANTFDLGSSDRPWRDVHLSGATLVIGGTELASGELTVLDNITAGTVSASKAVIADSSKDITGFRNVNAVSYSINGTAIASTAAELNILDGVTSTTAELNLLDGLTATTSELNLLDFSEQSSISTKFLRGDGTWQTVSGGGGSGGHTLQNAGSDLTARTNLNFDGTYVIATDDSGNDQTDIALSSALQAWHSKARPSGVVIGTTDSQTLTNKTLTSSVLNTGVSGTAVLDEDDLSSDSATQLATQQSIKAYVDSQTAGDAMAFAIALG
jgi:hypothetical protein